MAWMYLLLAGLLEIGWAVGLKLSEGFAKPVPSLATLLAILLSFGFLSIALKQIPLGTAYAVWTGIGAAGTAAVGMILFGEPRDLPRLICLAAIVGGVLGLRMTSSP